MSPAGRDVFRTDDLQLALDETKQSVGQISPHMQLTYPEDWVNKLGICGE